MPEERGTLTPMRNRRMQVRMLVACALFALSCASCALVHERTGDAERPATEGGVGNDAASTSIDAPSPTDAPVARDVGSERADASESCAADPPLEWTADGTFAETGHRYDFVETGGPVTFVPGHSGSAFSLDGRGHLEAPNVVGGFLDRVTDGLTVEAWIRLASVPFSARIIDKITVGTGDGFLLDVYGAALRFIGGDIPTAGRTPMPTGRWVHVAATFDGARNRVYVDGVMTTDIAVLVPTIAHNVLPLRLGAD